MARLIKNESIWRNQPENNVTLRTKILRIIRNPYNKTNNFKIDTIEAAEEQKMKAEHEKTKAAYFLLRRPSVAY
jgi:hypothetical protein